MPRQKPFFARITQAQAALIVGLLTVFIGSGVVTAIIKGHYDLKVVEQQAEAEMTAEARHATQTAQAAASSTSSAMPTATSTPTPTLTPTALPTPTPVPVVMSRAVALQTYHKKDGKNRYVTAMDYDSGWVLRGETSELKASERFTLLCLDNDKVAFQTCHKQDGKNRYVTAMGSDWSWVLRGETTELLAFEQFTLHDVDTEEPSPCLEVLELLKQGEVRVALQTCHKNDAGDKYRYVTAMNDEDDRDWKLVAQADEVKDWEKFTLIPLP